MDKSPMSVIFDSCVWIGLATGQLDQRDLSDVKGDMPVFTSVISIGELVHGVEACTDPARRAERAAYLRRIENQPTLGISRHTAAAFGVLAAAMKHSGRSPRPRYNDLWIAAQAIEHGYTLLTINAKDFAGLPGLQLLTLRQKTEIKS
jgi:predicted nucleic acid-binding protein